MIVNGYPSSHPLSPYRNEDNYRNMASHGTRLHSYGMHNRIHQVQAPYSLFYLLSIYILPYNLNQSFISKSKAGAGF